MRMVNFRGNLHLVCQAICLMSQIQITQSVIVRCLTCVGGGSQMVPDKGELRVENGRNLKLLFDLKPFKGKNYQKFFFVIQKNEL